MHRMHQVCGFGNGKLRFLDSGKVPERIVAFCWWAEFTFSCKLLNHLFSTLAVRRRRDSASSEESCVVCLQDFRGVFATFILPTCPELFPNFSCTFKTVWVPHFTPSVESAAPEHRTLDQSPTRSAPCLLSTSVTREAEGSVLTRG